MQQYKQLMITIGAQAPSISQTSVRRASLLTQLASVPKHLATACTRVLLCSNQAHVAVWFAEMEETREWREGKKIERNKAKQMPIMKRFILVLAAIPRVLAALHRELAPGRATEDLRDDLGDKRSTLYSHSDWKMQSSADGAADIEKCSCSTDATENPDC